MNHGTQRPLAILISAFAALAAVTAPAAAAPLWIERQFIPSAALVDAVFAESKEASIATVDHEPWAAFLESYIVEIMDGVQGVRYGAVSKTDAASLAAYIAQLESVDVTTLAPAEQLAFWINLYNAATIALILNHYPADGIRDIDNPWGEPRVTVNGIALSLNDIESGVIRPVFNDPRIHYAVNCASIGCPNLATTPYTGATLDAMLDDAARAYINHPRGVRVEDGDVIASKIYGWYREDFGERKSDVIDHIRQYASPALLQQLEGAKKIDDYEYNWSLNDATAE